MRLMEKVAIITGAGSGIGHATAVKFAHEGAKVAVCDINETSAHDVAREINDNGGEALPFASTSPTRTASRGWSRA